MYVERTKARIDEENKECRYGEEVRMKFSADELPLATLPGADFDPTHGNFSLDELKPQPIIRKRKRVKYFIIRILCHDITLLTFEYRLAW